MIAVLCSLNEIKGFETSVSKFAHDKRNLVHVVLYHVVSRYGYNLWVWKSVDVRFGYLKVQ